MSLNEQQRETTRQELQANFELTGFTTDQVRADLDMTADELAAAFAVEPGSNGTHVWRLRDYLQQTLEDQGKEPVPFTVLTVNRYFPYPR